ncbi:MAG: glucosamine-6-phosphate deaminase [Oscillospiraceae bacterium]|nr:glucosamine-6-phosphate deaminase [Oscillospiraceae bacterium]MDE7171535.1 glucosamine-6-phosphate deaminase [Oscillospiraceae bacterium]
MRIYCEKDYNAMSRRAANIIAAQILSKPDCVLGLATGSTPVGAYKELVEWYKQGDLSFAEVRSVNLDEYCGLAPDHDQSYRYFMQDNLFNHVDIEAESTNVPSGLAEDPAAECLRYEWKVAELGYADLQLLGLGRNGHIGFNEPCDHFPKQTHLVDLTESTIEANSRFFASADDVPRQALTMGIGTIMKARKILIVASGADKADAVCRAFNGPITPEMPASILQLHPDVTLVADEAALAKLKEANA